VPGRSRWQHTGKTLIERKTTGVAGGFCIDFPVTPESGPGNFSDNAQSGKHGEQVCNAPEACSHKTEQQTR